MESFINNLHCSFDLQSKIDCSLGEKAVSLVNSIFLSLKNAV